MTFIFISYYIVVILTKNIQKRSMKMQIKSIEDIENNPIYSDFLSKLLGKMKKSKIKPLTDDEPQVLQTISEEIFKNISSESISIETLKEVSKKTFLQWRGNIEVGISIMHDLPKIKNTSTKNVTVKTEVLYGYGCRKYSDFAKKDAKAKKMQSELV